MAAVLRLSPSICVYQDENCENVIIEVALPGVEKKDVSFKVSTRNEITYATN
jgi:HSP20 family molecular chaperone IbpA